MTEGDDTAGITPEEIQIQLLEDIWDAIRLHLRPDMALESLVKIANEHGLEVNLTLMVGGTVVSGTIVGGRTFFQGQADEIEEAEGLAKEAFAPAWRQLADVYPDSAAKEDQEPSGPNIRNAYIHLRDATIHSDQARMKALWWRGRLSSVDGFCFGEPSFE